MFGFMNIQFTLNAVILPKRWNVDVINKYYPILESIILLFTPIHIMICLSINCNLKHKQHFYILNAESRFTLNLLLKLKDEK